MSAPLQPSSAVEDLQIAPTPCDSGKVHTRQVPSSLWILERLGTGLAFLYLPILIVIQTAAVVSHWCGQQVADQTMQFLIFVLASVMAIGLCYLAIAGMRQWQPVTPPPGSGNSSKGSNDSSHRFPLATIIYASCILAFLRYETPLFATLTILVFAGDLLWQRWRCHQWGTAIHNNFRIMAIFLMLRQVVLPFLIAYYRNRLS